MKKNSEFSEFKCLLIKYDLSLNVFKHLCHDYAHKLMVDILDHILDSYPSLNVVQFHAER